MSEPDFELVETIEEANAQVLDVPEYEGWFEFAHSISGYNLEKKLRLERYKLFHNKGAQYRETGTWEGTLLELRIVLFYEARSFHFHDLSYATDKEKQEHRDYIGSLLAAIRQSAAESGQLAPTDKS